MNVMNIKHYLSAAAALALFAACSDYDPGISENAVNMTDAEIATIKEYTANFVERYGEIDPNHTWGFGELADMDEMGTRAVQVERPNWTILVDENGKVKVKGTVGTNHVAEGGNGPYQYYTYSEKAGYIVPGFPSAVDGIYYFEKDDQQYAWTQQQIETWESQQSPLDQYTPTRAAGLQPVGDVTDEEIQYVSWWFRNNPNPKSVTPPFTEFFMQNISKDLDREIIYDKDGNPVSAHGEYINNGMIPKMDSDKPTGNIVMDNNQNILYDSSSYGMDHLIVYTTEADPEHLNNFNSSSTNAIEANTTTDPYKRPAPAYPYRELKYWETEGGYTTSFSYQCPSDVDSKIYTDYVLVHLTFDIPQGDGTSHHYDGYYLAFDYEMHKHNTDGTWSNIFPDGFYSNWIVKLSPGNPTWKKTRIAKFERRVMCEDLGETDDFDFNDVVFDVKYTREEEKDSNDEWVPVGNGTWTGTITLRASGGTLPIYIENFDGTQYECHETMGGTKMSETLYNPINVGTNLTKDAVTLPSVSGLTSTNPDNVHIYVYKADGTLAGTDITYPERQNLQKFGTNAAPQKICMPTDVRWLKERKQIETAYPHFREWVVREDGAAGFGNENDWTREDINEGPLY